MSTTWIRGIEVCNAGDGPQGTIPGVHQVRWDGIRTDLASPQEPQGLTFQAGDRALAVVTCPVCVQSLEPAAIVVIDLEGAEPVEVAALISGLLAKLATGTTFRRLARFAVAARGRPEPRVAQAGL